MTVKMLFLLLQISLSLAAPFQFPFLQPLQGTLQQQQLAMQEQMFALQQFQALQRLSAPSPMMMNQPQPLLLLLPEAQSIISTDKQYSNFLKNHKPNPQGTENEDADSITIDSDPNTDSIDRNDRIPMRAILLVPNGRFSLGGFISSIPFLPFEINVPDSISWIYNGISGIISGIGQNWPFNFRPQSNENQSEMNNENQSENNVKAIWKNLKTRGLTPIVVMPLRQSMLQGQPMVPMQV